MSITIRYPKMHLGNIHEYDDRAVIEEMLRRLLDQGTYCILEAPAPGRTVQCAYRNDRGQACQIGLMIRDEDYKPAFERNRLEEVYTAIARRIRAPHFLALMQDMHDSAAEMGLPLSLGALEGRIRGREMPSQESVEARAKIYDVIKDLEAVQ